jgi:uncharacterized protein with HEPN domain
MPPHDPRKFLWDAREAADMILAFTRGKRWEDFAGDALLRSAVERQFEIVGEALGRLAKADPNLARAIPDLGRIVAFRNILIHGYAMVDRRTVWRAVEENVPDLRATLSRMIEEA